MRMKSPIAPDLGRLARISAWLLLFNGMAGLLVPLSAALLRDGVTSTVPLPAITPLCGVAAGLLAFRWPWASALVGVGFYAAQAISFFSPGFNFSLKSGLSLASVHVLPQGVLVLNWAAVVLGGLGAFLAWQGWRGKAGQKPLSLKVENHTTSR